MSIVGNGSGGSADAGRPMEEKIARSRWAAARDVQREKAFVHAGVTGYTDVSDLFWCDNFDAVLSATPHPNHTTIALRALNSDLHVLLGKPLLIHSTIREQLMGAHRSEDAPVCATIFNQRTDIFCHKVRELVPSGEFGKVQRISWLITSWFRYGAYYPSGDWRANCVGEGGGVLLDQGTCDFEFWQRECCVPRCVGVGSGNRKYQQIKIDDQVTAYLEDDNGWTGVVVTSTTEASGTNYLGGAGKGWQVVCQSKSDKLTFGHHEIAAPEFSRSTQEEVAAPEAWDIDCRGQLGQRVEINQNFIDAILDRTELIAPANNGI